MHPRENPEVKPFIKYFLKLSSYPNKWSFSLFAFTGVGRELIMLEFFSRSAFDFGMRASACLAYVCEQAWGCSTLVALIVGEAESDPTDSPHLFPTKGLHIRLF